MHMIDTTDTILSDGLKAFAEWQAAQALNIAKDWDVKWRAVRICAKPIINSMPDGYQEEEYVCPSKMIKLYIKDEGYEAGIEDF